MTQKFVYTFGADKAEGSASMKELLGGKGANLAEMCRLGLPVPPGITITTEACNHYLRHQKFPDHFETEVKKGIQTIETMMGAKFGSAENPLLVSVRSGARASMPGMMDTILNLGLNEKSVHALEAQTKNKAFAADSFRRLKEMFQDVVEKPLPNDPWEQLWEAIRAVFGSWHAKRAIEYRRIHHIPADWGTACNVQAMVFGNMGATSGTGVAFTRNPSTGERKIFGEVLMNAQGEDVVAGLRTPQPLETLQKIQPEAYQRLLEIFTKLEKTGRDMQDMEFTIQNGTVWMLQTRSGKRTARAAVKIAVDMVNENLISKTEALERIHPEQIEQLLHPMIDPKEQRKAVARGLPASPGAAVGKVVFTADTALAWAEKNEPVILVRDETSPEDIHGMNVAKGILTSRGGMTSHAAVVARGMGRVCVVGLGELHVDETAKLMRLKGKTIREGEWITVDGSTGGVFLEKLKTTPPEFTPEFHTLIGWADGVAKMKVRANADTPRDCRQALAFGATGIGLCRTEHMFFDPERIAVIRQMIVSDTLEDRTKALAKLLPMQRGDFLEIFRIMQGLPVTIRLLDPPLHEFLPTHETELTDLAKEMGIPLEKLQNKVETLHEVNPMLGWRGCRLGIIYPEIYEMQVQAIMEAVCQLKKEGIETKPEIELPLIGLRGEIQKLRPICEKICEQVQKKFGVTVPYKIGTMIETPRACMRADAIAEYADFLSFGTNDLTQTTMGISRDDGFKFIPQYEAMGLVDKDPFQTIDFRGVGEIMKTAVTKARAARPGMEIGICGEHGGDPASIHFCHEIGLNYVSCSPFRIPLARLSSAQAVLKMRKSVA